MKKYEYIIIGTGQATGVLLGDLLKDNKPIAVIEGHKVGGSCVNYGCTPTKALVASARAIHIARRGEEFGFTGSNPKIDFNRVMERMNDIRNSSREGMHSWLENEELIDYYQGWGSFADDHTVAVNNEHIYGKKIFINTGTRPDAPKIDGLEEVNWLDSAGMLKLTSLPKHLVIIGGGYIGCEFAQMFRRFGSEVTLIQKSSQLMPQEDEIFSKEIRSFLEDEGVEIICDAETERVQEHNEEIVVRIIEKSAKREVTGSHLLLAAGRSPNTDKLNLKNTGVRLDNKGFIEVNDHCQTAVEHIFAVGDVNGHGAFTHTSVNDGEIVNSYLSGGNRKISDRTTIYGLFSDPPLGRVGMTEKEALNAGKKILKAIKPMKEISRAEEMSETRGMAQLLVDQETDLILGASILGPGADEIINMFAAIIHSKIPCHEYRKVVLVHPTVSELMPWVLDGLEPVDVKNM